MSKRSELLRAAAAEMIKIAEGLEQRAKAAKTGGASKVRGDSDYYRKIRTKGYKRPVSPQGAPK